jgi:non-ribosomal peptide synthetase component F
VDDLESATCAEVAESETESDTYRELRRRAYQLACFLRRLGLDREQRVEICAERSPQMTGGLLGAASTSAAAESRATPWPG